MCVVVVQLAVEKAAFVMSSHIRECETPSEVLTTRFRGREEGCWWRNAPPSEPFRCSYHHLHSPNRLPVAFSSGDCFLLKATRSKPRTAWASLGVINPGEHAPQGFHRPRPLVLISHRFCVEMKCTRGSTHTFIKCQESLS